MTDKKATIKAIRGFYDILPGETALWRHIEREAYRVFSTYGFREIILPAVEKTELFTRSIGETTDIVEKEMYTFPDRRGDSMTLRPEGTAPAVRAYIEHKLYIAPLTKLYYTGAMFRYERPQKGRYRQFFQIGAEVLGDPSPRADAETIEMLARYFAELGIEDASLEINSLGCSGCRPNYKEQLLKYLHSIRQKLCENCRRRIEKNPLRALDCKSEHCIEATKEAPSIIDTLCNGCAEHLGEVKRYLKALNVSYNINKRMVRGLDYYTRTTFEIVSSALGAQNTIAAGGRYDTLVADLGGPDTPCIGFAIGIERLSLVLKESAAYKEGAHEKKLVYVVAISDGTLPGAIELVRALRSRGINVEADYDAAKLKSSMKRADRIGADYAIIIGEDELRESVVTTKDLKSGEQRKLKPEEAVKLVAG